MSVTMTNRRSDPRVLCGILARAALDHFQVQQDQDDEDPREVYFTNLIRVLEMYRYGALRSYNPQGILSRGVHATVRLPKGTDPMKAVEAALVRAHDEVFPGQDRTVVVATLRSTLEHIRDGHQPPPQDLQTARAFLEAFTRHLQTD